jgi:hypothetical protein
VSIIHILLYKSSTYLHIMLYTSMNRGLETCSQSEVTPGKMIQLVFQTVQTWPGDANQSAVSHP